MDRTKFLTGHPSNSFYRELHTLHDLLFSEFKKQFNRSLPFTDEIFDRWERARRLNFGEGSSIYDSSYVFGDVKVGKGCWLGPFTIIDGSGGLIIGENCTISAGVHIYTHDNLKQTLSGGLLSIEHKATFIGACTYIGPQSVIASGVRIGKHCVIACNSFVNNDIPDYSIVAGNPTKLIGRVMLKDNDVIFDYNIANDSSD